MPALEAALPRFRAADTQVLGVSIDSVFSHANWARDLGGVSFPLLADFQPKGAVANSFGHYLADAGITDRATVLVDKDGVVKYSVSVTPSGSRNVDELVELCERIDRELDKKGSMGAAQPVPGGATLFVKSHCGASRRALLAVDNLGLRDRLTIRNVSEDPAAAKALLEIGGKDQAPCLTGFGANAVYEAADIGRLLADCAAPLAS